MHFIIKSIVESLDLLLNQPLKMTNGIDEGSSTATRGSSTTLQSSSENPVQGSSETQVPTEGDNNTSDDDLDDDDSDDEDSGVDSPRNDDDYGGSVTPPDMGNRSIEEQRDYYKEKAEYDNEVADDLKKNNVDPLSKRIDYLNRDDSELPRDYKNNKKVVKDFIDPDYISEDEYLREQLNIYQGTENSHRNRALENQSKSESLNESLTNNNPPVNPSDNAGVSTNSGNDNGNPNSGNDNGGPSSGNVQNHSSTIDPNSPNSDGSSQNNHQPNLQAEKRKIEEHEDELSNNNNSNQSESLNKKTRR